MSVLEELREPEDRRDFMAALPELVLKDSCTGCGATLDLYGSSCRHLTLCVKCGKSMAETAAPCSDCGVPITRLIRVWSLHPFSALSFFLFHLPHITGMQGGSLDLLCLEFEVLVLSFWLCHKRSKVE